LFVSLQGNSSRLTSNAIEKVRVLGDICLRSPSREHLGVCLGVRRLARAYPPSFIDNNGSIIGIGLRNGGTAGSIWMFIAVCFGMFFVVLSMAEMASMLVLCSPSANSASLTGAGPPQREDSITGSQCWLRRSIRSFSVTLLVCSASLHIERTSLTMRPRVDVRRRMAGGHGDHIHGRNAATSRTDSIE
jgi:hypothetical protein